MHLKSLVLKGFKSFADRSVLSLEPGITAIVGPNGSGKSNISDAVLWVLGERNAKNLRGQAMEDVIFAGSSARKSVGVAEVELVLDNSDGTLPVEYAEVSIARRMFRSGESEYLINGAVARRMDVLDILHDSGLGTGTHSIIGQGNLDSILQSRPEDRRALIEEAAGVLKHKQRKAKSERKLEQMDRHLTRVHDVVGEVQRQLGPLERKAKRAIAYQGLATELAELNLALSVDDLRTLQKAHGEACESERALEAELEAKRAVISEAEQQVEALQEKIRRESTDAGELSRKHRLAAQAAERIDSTTLLMRERRRAAQARAGELQVTLEANRAKRATAEADLRAAEEQLETARAEGDAAQNKVAELKRQRDELAKQRDEREREAVELGRAGRELERRIDVARRKHAEMQETLSNGLAHIKLIESRAKELDLQLTREQGDAEAQANAAAACARKLEEAIAHEGAARTRVAEALRARDEARVAYDEARDEERAVAGAIQGLEEVERASAAAAGPALSWVMEQGANLDAALSPLSHAVSASARVEALVERLLGADVTALLVQNDARACAVADALAENGSEGEVALVLRDDVATEARALRYSGAQGTPLVKELAYAPEAARAVEALLGDVVVCDTLKSALREHAHDKLGLRFAALDGAIVWQSGKVLLGAAAADNGEGVLARVRHLEELRAQYKAARKTSEFAAQAAADTEEALREAQAESLTISQQVAQLRGETDAARTQAQRAEEKLAAVRREREDVQRQREEAEKLIATARPDVEQYAAEADDLSKRLETTKTNQAAAQDAAEPLREQLRRVSGALNEAKLSAATLAERRTYAERVRDARTAELRQLTAADDEAHVALTRKTVSATRIEPLLALFDELALSARRWTTSLEDAATAAQTSSSGLHAVANEARARAREAHAAFDAVNERLAQARVDKGRLEVQVEAAVNIIVSDCKTPLETALALPELENRAEKEDNAFKLRRRIANMGTINPDAAEEYEALKTRYDYLQAQLTDLDSARKALAKINRAIEARMKDDFLRTFEAVNDNFQEIFAVLFPGGSAHLSLVDPNDLENTGVEVSAQPRGKRITKMMLMSGGEKSLTALALLFAVYRIRTTPFYILDEVEAALDDSNLRRLVSYIDALRETTQLIMITHQRRTMEMADVLFGVSMQADGVTKVISQKLDQALRHAE